MRAYILIHHNGWYKNVFFSSPSTEETCVKKKEEFGRAFFVFFRLTWNLRPIPPIHRPKRHTLSEFLIVQ